MSGQIWEEKGGNFFAKGKRGVLNEDIHLLTNPFSVFFFSENVGSKTYLLENEYIIKISAKTVENRALLPLYQSNFGAKFDPASYRKEENLSRLSSGKKVANKISREKNAKKDGEERDLEGSQKIRPKSFPAKKTIEGISPALPPPPRFILTQAGRGKFFFFSCLSFSFRIF